MPGIKFPNGYIKDPLYANTNHSDVFTAAKTGFNITNGTFWYDSMKA